MKPLHTTSHRRLVGELADLFQVDEQSILTLLNRPTRPLPHPGPAATSSMSSEYRAALDRWIAAELHEPSKRGSEYGRTTIGAARDRLQSWHDVRQFRGSIPSEYFVG